MKIRQKQWSESLYYNSTFLAHFSAYSFESNDIAQFYQLFGPGSPLGSQIISFSRVFANIPSSIKNRFKKFHVINEKFHHFIVQQDLM